MNLDQILRAEDAQLRAFVLALKIIEGDTNG